MFLSSGHGFVGGLLELRLKVVKDHFEAQMEDEISVDSQIFTVEKGLIS